MQICFQPPNPTVPSLCLLEILKKMSCKINLQALFRRFIGNPTTGGGKYKKIFSRVKSVKNYWKLFQDCFFSSRVIDFFVEGKRELCSQLECRQNIRIQNAQGNMHLCTENSLCSGPTNTMIYYVMKLCKSHRDRLKMWISSQNRGYTPSDILI